MTHTPTTVLVDLDGLVIRTALAAGYTPKEAHAGVLFSARKARRVDPPGQFDKAGRFYAAERTAAVLGCRQPTRAWPYAEMTAARTAAHCAEVRGLGDDDLLAVRRVCRARDLLDSLGQPPALSAHARLPWEAAASALLRKALKPIKRPAVAVAA